MTEMVWTNNANDQQDPDAYGYPETHERREYNSSNQLTRIDASAIGQPNTVDLNYQYPAGQNNGQVASLTDNAGTGRTATYTYDPLMRLASVSGQVNQAYSYDGWGNLYSRTGTGQNFNLYVDAAKNRLLDQLPPAVPGIYYDANGNMISMTGGRDNPDFAYNINNRLVWSHTSQGDRSSETYVYTADNKRVSTVRPNGTTAQVFFLYGAKSEIAAVCTSQLPGGAPVCEVREPRDMKFAGRIVRQNYLPATVDRLGSVASPSANNTPSKNFAPFGEQLNAAQSPNVFPGNTGFATYWGDPSTGTGLNYADQRFYSANYGRFMSADPYRASAGPEGPASWNRYAYVGNDPINKRDPTGSFSCDPEDPNCEPDPCQSFAPNPACGPGPDPDPGPGPGPSPGPSPSPIITDISCSVTLYWRPVQPDGALSSFNHAYIYITKSITRSGESTEKSVDLVEGLPERNEFNNWGLLRTLVFYDFDKTGGDPQDNPTKDAHFNPLVGSLNTCRFGADIENNTGRGLFSGHPYDPSGRGLYIDNGRNSNWFAHQVLASVGLFFGNPPSVPGW